MFQQRHFEAIARSMQSIKPNPNQPEALRQWEITLAELGDLFISHNHNFMRARFESACEPGANVRARGTQRAKGSGFSKTSHG